MRRLPIALLSACARYVLGAAQSASYPVHCNSTASLFRALEASLSPDAVVFYPGSEGFQTATKRWSELESPTADVLIVPATEDDVARTVRQAHEYGIHVLAFNGVHGAITTLGGMQGGVAISLSQLSSVEVAEDGKTATIGGGTASKFVTDTLWNSGKQTVTGTCECVSYLGPALGGGHGWLQGHHGLVADQFTSMNIALASGALETIDSSSDLWWAMKGAGQNFGIVTSVTVKVYDIEHTDWAIETFIFSGDMVEAVYETANKHFANLTSHVINWSYWLNMPDVDPDRPVILFYIIQEGVTVVDSVYTSPFRDIGPISSEAQSGTYRDLATWTNIAVDSPPCQKAGLANPRFPMYLRQYNVAAQREAYDSFAAKVGGDSPFSNSIFMFEAYPQQGVRAIDRETTAFAFRDDSLLVAPLITYAPAGKELEDEAKCIGNQLRTILREGSGREELHAYVNYAYGDESAKGWYGHETWRQERLKELKMKYDPNYRFSFYAPVP
ncbi:hypothetical protein NPX13_g2106 [Xylaria arbuscula]|uniref:FAD-binding PCMH-type domain-containing protein n=1 Tax=Xylaria arbuscula TaxID=114810 RepID=A0A9W8NKN2_9PEZI|nr:hypothetical protein NPX13_g2106 [Xylaria arbuscula]